MNKSTATTSACKPEKPYPGFPLFAHPSGQWAKKIRKRLVYFGSWRTDPQGNQALECFNREWPYLKEGRTPPAVDTSGGLTVRQLVNAFLHSKQAKLESGDLAPRSFRDYYKTCQGMVDHFGKDRRVDDLRPDDFRAFRSKLAKRLGVVSLKNEINRVSIVFNFAYPVGSKNAHRERLIDRPVNYGAELDKPSAKALRRSRNEAGPKLFEAWEVRRILDALEGKPVETGRTNPKTGEPERVTLPADPIMRAMLLLALNGALGNSDVANVPESAVDFDSGWLTYPRVKTEIPRRIPLWAETLVALKTALAVRPKPVSPEAKGLCFLTCRGRPWVRMQEKAKNSDGGETDPASMVPIDTLSQQFGKVLRKLRINGRRGLGFYTGRHCFETQAGESRDQPAVDSIMGHVDGSMSANYRHHISDARLRSVVEVVRKWVPPPSFWSLMWHDVAPVISPSIR